MLSAPPSIVQVPVGLFFLFSYTGHKFIFCRGRPQKSSPRRFLVFSRISNRGPRWPLQARHLKFTERGITHTALSSCEIELKVKVNKRCFPLLPLHENVQNIDFSLAQEKKNGLFAFTWPSLNHNAFYDLEGLCEWKALKHFIIAQRKNLTIMYPVYFSFDFQQSNGQHRCVGNGWDFVFSLRLSG